MTENRYHILEDAWQDIDNAAEFILERDPDTVNVVSRLYDAVEETAALVCLQPNIYTPHPHFREATKGLRRCPLQGFDNYTLYYRVNEKGVVVVFAVIHGARNHDELFKNRKKRG